MKLRKFGRILKRTIKKNLSTGLVVGAMVGVPVTCYFVAKETPKAMKALEEAEDCSKIEKAGIMVSSYKKSIAFGAATEAMILGNHIKNTRRIAALTGLAASQVSKRKEVDKAVKELFGDDANEVQKKIVEEKISNSEIMSDAIQTGNGDTLCYEPVCGHFFYSSQRHIQQAIFDINESATKHYDDYVDFNAIFKELGLPTCTFGDNFGFPVPANGKVVEVVLDAEKTYEGLPYLVLNFMSDWTEIAFV